jgi:hypothetical protein
MRGTGEIDIRATIDSTRFGLFPERSSHGGLIAGCTLPSAGGPPISKNVIRV